MIPYGRQDVSDADIQAVVAVLQSDFITQGPAIERFEAAVAAYCGVPHAVAVCNATAALHIACLAVGLGPGDWLWTVPNTFVATANCALYCGASVDFVDSDPRTYTMDMDQLAEKLATAQKTNRLPKVVAPVAFAGQSCNMRRLRALADEYGFLILEDAAHAIGGRYEGQPVGDCRYADMTVFSFHPVKIITTGEGGMVMTRRGDLAEKLRLLRSHGITRNPEQMTAPPEGAWAYEQIDLGFNYRMTDIQAALGASQMDRLETFIKRRRELAARYDALLSNLPVVPPWQHPDTQSAYHLYPVCLPKDRMASGDIPGRQVVFDRLREAGIGVNVHYIPVHTQPYYRQLGFQPGDFPQAETYYQSAISLPLYATLTDAQQNTVVDALREALKVEMTAVG